MIGTLSIKINAANPNLPLKTLFAYVNSPSSIRVIDVPKKIGKWNITQVFITATYPDNSIVSSQCVLTGGCWTGTIQGSTSVGKSLNGYTISANGIDENGNQINGYILGKSDVVILDADGRTVIDGKVTYLHLLDTTPDDPKEGDVIFEDGNWKIYRDNQWIDFGTKDIYWGTILGDLTQQHDLNDALAQKASTTYVDDGLSAKRDYDDLTYEQEFSDWVFSDGIERELVIRTKILPDVIYSYWYDYREEWESVEHFDTQEEAENATHLTFETFTASRTGGTTTLMLKSEFDELVPAQASKENQLADKDFVNSSIVTNTAYFKGTYNSVQELPQTRVTPNDYAFVIRTDELGQTYYDRYKYTADGQWLFEYSINNSGFTAAQFAAINSGITAEKVEQIDIIQNELDGVEETIREM